MLLRVHRIAPNIQPHTVLVNDHKYYQKTHILPNHVTRLQSLRQETAS